MAGTQVNPTRMELTRLKKKLVTATKGHKLLKDKRDELMRQFLEKVRENKALREHVELGIQAANKNFLLARAGMQDEVLNTALLAPKQKVSLESGVENVMSVEIPKFTFKTRTPDENDMFSYGFAFTSSDLDDAIQSLADIFPDMLKLAECEKSCQLMAAGQRPGACNDPGPAAKYQIYHHEAGRKRAFHPDPANESKRYDAGTGPRVRYSLMWKIRKMYFFPFFRLS